MDNNAPSPRWLIKCADWIHRRGWFYTNKTVPYVFASVCAWLGIAGPELAEKYKAASSWYASLWAIASQAPVLVALAIFIVAILSARHSASILEGLEARNETLQDSEAQIRTQLDDAEQHGEFLRHKFHDLLTRGAASFLKRQSMEIESFGDHARASLYAHIDSQFILAGRFTEHPVFCKPNRQRFPDDQGCIGDAWRNGGECYWELPDPEKNYDDYAEILKTELKINKGEAKNLRMQSRFYYAKAIVSDSMRVGVVVYESTKPDVLIEEQLKNIVERDEENLARIVEQAQFVNPFILIQRGREE